MVNSFMKALLTEKGFGPQPSSDETCDEESSQRTVFIVVDNARLPSFEKSALPRTLSNCSMSSAGSALTNDSFAPLNERNSNKAEGRFSTGDSSDDEIFFQQRRRLVNGRRRRVKNYKKTVDNYYSSDDDQPDFVMHYESSDDELAAATKPATPTLPDIFLQNPTGKLSTGGDQGQSLVDMIQLLSYRAALSLSRHGETWMSDDGSTGSYNKNGSLPTVHHRQPDVVPPQQPHSGCRSTLPIAAQ